jgi:hypothetical protein
MNTPAVTPADDAAPQWGPAMQALNTDRQRAFVCALYDEEAPARGRGLLQYAVKKAGYGSERGSTDKALSVIANRLVNDKRIQAAAAEYARSMVRSISPAAVQAVRAMIKDTKHKDHARAVAMILDRVDPIETTHTVRVEDYRAPDQAATAAVLQRIAQLAAQAGLPKLPAPTDAVDVEYTEIPADD